VSQSVGRLADAFRAGTLVLIRPRASAVADSAGAATPPAPADDQVDSSPQKPKSKKTWVALKLVDQDNQPVSGEKYHIELPDGSTRDGETDAAGEGWVEDIDPGNCKFSFPDLDASEWTAV